MHSAVRWFHHQARTVPWFGRLILRLLPDVHWTVQIPGVGSFRIRLRRNRSFLLRPPLTHEGFMLGALQRFVRPGDVAYDVGANLGLYCRYISTCFHAGKIVAFEPSPDNLEELRGNLALGGITDQVQVMPIALGDNDGEESFQIDDISSASGTLNRVTDGEACQARAQYGLPPKLTSVRVAKLDSIVESGQAAPPQVIKIDVEGAEDLVLRGAVNTLRRHGPILIMELHGAAVARQVVEDLHAVNYRVFAYFREHTAAGDDVYQEIKPRHYPLIRDFYSLHHLIAGPDATVLAAPVQEFDLGKCAAAAAAAWNVWAYPGVQGAAGPHRSHAETAHAPYGRSPSENG